MEFGDMPLDQYPDLDKELANLAGNEPWVTEKKLDTANENGWSVEEMVKRRMGLKDPEDRKEMDTWLEGETRLLSPNLIQKLFIDSVAEKRHGEKGKKVAEN